MSSSKTLPPSYNQIIAALMRSANGPVPAAAIIDQLLAAHPSQAKNPRTAARNHLRQAVGRELVFLDTDTLLPLRLALQGARFRLPLERDSVKTGLVAIEDSLAGYLPPRFAMEKLRLVDAAGQPIPFQTKTRTEKVQTPFGPTTLETRQTDLSAWFQAQRIDRQDHLVLSIINWEQGIVQLECEPYSRLDQKQRGARNQMLADLFYEQLESAANEMLVATEAVPTIYARLPDKGGYPPDHWAAVVATDKRLYTDGWQIRYGDDDRSFMDFLLTDPFGEDRVAPAGRISKEQGAQVYRFRAALRHRLKLWRTIEIQGKQTLGDLDRAMRSAFNHDDWDHLGGFWKLITRGGPGQTGKQKPGARRGREREVELGDVHPDGGGSGAKVKLAELELAVGDRVKYVYDFGDWIEHELTLEAISAPEKGVKYPREAGRNQPAYANCVDCAAAGRQTTAEWICLDCSDEQGKDVLLCEACATSSHEDHYTEEILY
jgi:hypothetical protein